MNVPPATGISRYILCVPNVLPLRNPSLHKLLGDSCAVNRRLDKMGNQPKTERSSFLVLADQFRAGERIGRTGRCRHRLHNLGRRTPALRSSSNKVLRVGATGFSHSAGRVNSGLVAKERPAVVRSIARSLHAPHMVQWAFLRVILTRHFLNQKHSARIDGIV